MGAVADTVELLVDSMAAEGPRAVVIQVDLGGVPFDYRAGQAVWLGRAARPGRVPYSIACAPGRARSTGHLEFLLGTDSRGLAGGHLEPLRPGARLSVSGPIGSFTLPDTPDLPPLLFVAGGVGIAPLRAMIQDALDRPVPPSLTLVHSARTPSDFAFASEFDAAAGRLRTIRTVTRAAAGGQYRTGRISRELLAELELARNVVCYVCGPDGLVEHVSQLLVGLGVPDARIRHEE